jgi:FkbM family methyltransferase
LTEAGHRRISYAQNGEDVRVWRALRDIPGVFYVEVGASHPLDDSVTAALSAEGWRGVLVEPEPAAADLLRANRQRDVVIAAAASDASGLLQWVNDGERGEGRVVEDRQGLAVPVVRLADVLDGLKVQDVHFMSFDVEGHERRALLGLDLRRWRPWILCVEATAPQSRTWTHATWEPLLLEAGYQFVTFDGLNRWYVSPEHTDLAEAVAEPFGVLDVMLDGWQRRELVDLESRLDEAVAEVDRLRQEHDGDVRQATALRDDVAALRNHIAGLRDHIAALQKQLAEADQLETQRLDQLEVQGRELSVLQRELDLVAAQRDAAMARERVMLESKSWRLTSPLRNARRNITNAAATRRAPQHPPPPVALPAHEATPGDQRRQRALLAKVAAAATRRAS